MSLQSVHLITVIILKLPPESHIHVDLIKVVSTSYAVLLSHFRGGTHFK